MDEDSWAVRWARAYVDFAAGEKRSWLDAQGVKLTPMVGWAERGDVRADGHGNRQASDKGLLTFYHRHQADELVVRLGSRSRGLEDVRLLHGADHSR